MKKQTSPTQSTFKNIISLHWTVCFRFVFSAISKTVSFWNLLGPFWWLVVVINDILLLLSKSIFCEISFVDLDWGMRAHVYSETVCPCGSPCVPVLNKVQLSFDLLWATAVIPVNIVFCFDSVSVCSDETSPLVDVCFIVDNYRFYCHKVSWVVITVIGNTQQSLRSTSACKRVASLLTSVSSRVIARKLVREPKQNGAKRSCSRFAFSTNSRGKLAVQASAQREFALAQFSPICIRTLIFPCIKPPLKRAKIMLVFVWSKWPR